MIKSIATTLQRPRAYLTGVSIFAAVGSAVSIYAGTVDWIASPFVWVGCFIIMRRAWQRESDWPEMLRSTMFWAGIALIVVGTIVTARSW